MENLDQLSAQDQQAIAGMQAALLAARVYNDSLSICAGCPLSLRKHYDSQYHHNDNLWYQHHGNYNHNNINGDHNNNASGMQHHMGTDNAQNHSQEHHYVNHQQMDSLHKSHVSLHPVN